MRIIRRHTVSLTQLSTLNSQLSTPNCLNSQRHESIELVLRDQLSAGSIECDTSSSLLVVWSIHDDYIQILLSPIAFKWSYSSSGDSRHAEVGWVDPSRLTNIQRICVTIWECELLCGFFVDLYQYLQYLILSCRVVRSWGISQGASACDIISSSCGIYRWNRIEISRALLMRVMCGWWMDRQKWTEWFSCPTRSIEITLPS